MEGLNEIVSIKRLEYCLAPVKFVLPAIIDNNQQHLLESCLWSLHLMQHPSATTSNQPSDEKPDMS